MARIRNKRALERRLEALEAQVGSLVGRDGKVPYKVYQEAHAVMVAHMGACVHALLADEPEPEPPAGYERAMEILESRSSPLSHSEAEQVREELKERFDRRAKAREQEHRDAFPRGGDGIDGPRERGPENPI